LLAEAILQNQREKNRHRRESGAESNVLTSDIGDLLVDGAEQLWRLITSR
jgi:hypothetical protein